ncbi:hypothetical protein R6242_18895 [Iodobacter sp. CM08]|uniref:hypothetical protein n=1 Tax=Iodobacter sp. CM08 TaxID=3085902 RepID=UPI00298166B4|nr:hypothetical protein [Iodobacter sp. CM08]MDW5418637.1 hypothetical protein [Iodobacter sp. CM08]
MKDPLNIYEILSNGSLNSQSTLVDYKFQMSALQAEAKRLGFNFVKTDEQRSNEAIPPELEYSLARAIKYSQKFKNHYRKEWMLIEYDEKRLTDSHLILNYILNVLSIHGIQLMQDPRTSALMDNERMLHENRYLINFQY